MPSHLTRLAQADENLKVSAFLFFGTAREAITLISATELISCSNRHFNILKQSRAQYCGPSGGINAGAAIDILGPKARTKNVCVCVCVFMYVCV